MLAAWGQVVVFFHQSKEHTVAEHHLASGRLVELPCALRLDVHLYWTVARLHAATLRRLTDAICHSAASQLASG